MDVKEDRAIIDAATPGPWMMFENEYENLEPSVQGVTTSSGHPPLLHIVVDPHAEEGEAGYWPVIMTKGDAAFIAAARTRWPAALDRIEELEAEAQHAREISDLRVLRLEDKVQRYSVEVIVANARTEVAEARAKELETRDANVAYEARTAARDLARDRADKAEARCAELAEALKFYLIHDDPGHVARAALAAAEGKP